MSELLRFESINIEVPFERIMRRLGFREGTTRLEGKKESDIKMAVLEASDLLELKGSARVLPILENSDGRVEIGFGSGDQAGKILFESNKLADFLAGQKDVVFAAATAGKRVTDRMQKLEEQKKLSDASIVDTTASEMTDDALEWIMNAVRVQLSPRGMEVSSRRYSAGFGDFALSYQAVFHRVLEMDLLGVSLTREFLLVPEKSVTALAGIWDL
ncbi:MAG: hypothetical protein EHM28_14270 [Spirochaetaceae bacterium]|nr:MAG: hypothetical protein EHM28_14270 [Spirochaetaceae bacterium]